MYMNDGNTHCPADKEQSSSVGWRNPIFHNSRDRFSMAGVPECIHSIGRT